MATVILVRHGENDWVKKHRLAGWIEGVHLNKNGRSQAKKAAKRLSGVPLKALYSSPVTRCMETAAYIAKSQNLDVIELEDVGEVRYGDWEGKKIKKLAKKSEWHAVQYYPSRFQFPEGEALREVQFRAVQMLEKLSARHGDDIIAIVSHADLIKLVLAHYLGVHIDLFQRIVISPASISVLALMPNGVVRVVRLNDNGKLKMPPAKQKDNDVKKKQPLYRSKGISMAQHIELNPVYHFTVGTVGDPGQRVFYIQGSQGSQVISLIIEKEQAAMLANSFDTLLEELDKKNPADARTGEEPVWTDLRLREPIEALFRVGHMGLGYNEETNQVVLVAYELVDEGEEPNVVSFWLTRAQAKMIVKHAREVVSSGRPICGNCGRPIDKEGHFCPNRNGHIH